MTLSVTVRTKVHDFYQDSWEKDLLCPTVYKLVRCKPGAAYKTATTTISNRWAYLEIKPIQEGRAKERRKLNSWLQILDYKFLNQILNTCDSSLFLKYMSQWFFLYVSGIFSWLSVTFNQKSWFILQQMSIYSICFSLLLWEYQGRPTQPVSGFWYQMGWIPEIYKGIRIRGHWLFIFLDLGLFLPLTTHC